MSAGEPLNYIDCVKDFIGLSTIAVKFTPGEPYRVISVNPELEKRVEELHLQVKHLHNKMDSLTMLIARTLPGYREPDASSD